MAASFRPPRGWRRRLSTPIAVIALVLTAAVRAASPPVDPNQAGAMWRLTEQQYRNAIADIFGEDIEVTGNIRRRALSQADLEEYDRMARGIAAQVVDERHRGALVGCAPRNVTLPDDPCSANFFRRTGRLLLRRPLTSADVQKHVTAAREATEITRDFYSGLAVSLASMLVSPKFLFDIDVLERDPARPGRQRLDAYSKASRLSLFLSNTTPDITLLEAAARGDLHSAPLLAKHVDRLLASPRLDVRIKAFFSEASGDTDGCEKNPVSFEYAVRLDPAAAACLTRKISEYGLRRPVGENEGAWIKDLTARLAGNGYQVRPLLREIATSDAFVRLPSQSP